MESETQIAGEPQIILAETMGLCFGVRDALNIVAKVASPQDTTIYGELVHNPLISKNLAERGFLTAAETARDELPVSKQVLITAHGLSQKRREILLSAGKTLIDTTCPLVRNVHEIAQRLQKEGHFVVLIGRRGHVEVQGIIEDLENFCVVQSHDDVTEYPHPKIAIICQATAESENAQRIVAVVKQKNRGKEINFIDTICTPTRNRQLALRLLLKKVEALVVVGGYHSNNTRQLLARAVASQVPCQQVENASQLNETWCRDFKKIGLTAGTSTPDSIIRSVYEKLCFIKGIRP